MKIILKANSATNALLAFVFVFTSGGYQAGIFFLLASLIALLWSREWE